MSSAEDVLRKKRKWDVNGPDSKQQTANVQQSSQPNEVDVKIAAQIAAQKITSMLAQQGVPAAMACELEVFINDYKPDTRYFMCKSTTHDEVGAATKCSIKVKGRYKAPNDPTAEKPLHLLVTGDTMENVNAAVKMLKDMIEEREKNQVSPPVATYSFEHKALVDMEGCDPQFGLLARLLGPNGSFFQHIIFNSGAKLQLRGIGSGTLEGPENQEAKEPLQIMITSSTRSSLDAAKALVDNLLSTVRQEYYSFVQMKNQSAAYGYQYYPGYYDYSQYAGYQYPATATGGQEQGGAQDYSAYYQYYQQYGAYPPTAEGTASTTPTQDASTSNGTETQPQKTVTEEDENAFYEELAKIDSSLSKKKETQPAAPAEPEKQVEPVAAPTTHHEELPSPTSSNSQSPQMKTEPETTGIKRTLTTSAEETKPSHKFNPKKQMLHSFTTTTSNSSSLNGSSNGKYEEETDNLKKQKTAPFWQAIDASDANPDKKHEKSAQQVSDIENEVYSELGLK